MMQTTVYAGDVQGPVVGTESAFGVADAGQRIA